MNALQDSLRIQFSSTISVILGILSKGRFVFSGSGFSFVINVLVDWPGRRASRNGQKNLRLPRGVCVSNSVSHNLILSRTLILVNLLGISAALGGLNRSKLTCNCLFKATVSLSSNTMITEKESWEIYLLL